MTLSSQQRINVALATGIKLRGKVKYECTVTPLTTRPEPMVRYTVTVEADNPHLAASEAAQHCAAKIEGFAGFVAPQDDETFIVCIGRQHPSGAGLTTHGFSIKVTVEAAP
jgi:hypothetical protein